MAVRSITSPLPAYPAGAARLRTRPPSWSRRWMGLTDPGPNRTINDGTIVAVGNGVARGFSWPHGLGVVPASAHVDDPLSLPLPEFRTGWDATNVFVLFNGPPSRNITLRWMAVAPDTGVVAPEQLVESVLLAESGLVLLTEDNKVSLTEGRF